MIKDKTHQELIEATRGCGFEKTYNLNKDYNKVKVMPVGDSCTEYFILMEVTVLSEIGLITGLCIERDSMGRASKVQCGSIVFERKRDGIFRAGP